MNKTTQKRIIKRIGDLIQTHCRVCDNNGEGKQPDDVCSGCPFYKELRLLGDKLTPLKEITDKNIRKREASVKLEKILTIEQYAEYKHKGLLEKDIANILGCNITTISRWKRRHKQELIIKNIC